MRQAARGPNHRATRSRQPVTAESDRRDLPSPAALQARLLANDEIGDGGVALGGGAIPENAVSARSAGGKARGVEHLNAVARPFSVACRLFRRAENDAALGAYLVQEQPSRQMIGIGRGALRSGDVV